MVLTVCNARRMWPGTSRRGEGRAGKCPALGRVLGALGRLPAVVTTPPLGPGIPRDWTPTAALRGWYPPHFTEEKSEAQRDRTATKCQPWDLNPELLCSEVRLFLEGPESKYFGLSGTSGLDGSHSAVAEPLTK